MDKNAIKKYAVWARNELIARVTQKAEQYEITEKKTTPKDADNIGGRLLTEAEKNQRKALIEKIQVDGFEQVMEEVAYTWFNRFTALRFMEVNNYLPSHTRVFTNESGEFKPQILADAIQLDLEGLNMDKVFELKDANKTEELYKYLLITQCNALSAILPCMFQKIEHYTELLLPDYLLREGSVIEQMIALIPEEDWTDQVQIIGWLYQYYNGEKKDVVFASLKKNVRITKENVPAATQLFTPDWIVRYLVENSLGRLWKEGHPNSNLNNKWDYYVDETIDGTNRSGIVSKNEEKKALLKPEEIRCIDPCSGSGHILCYLFDVLMQIYEDYGYTSKEAAASIVQNNIVGLDIDERASQLAYFSVMMKARQYDRRFLNRGIQPRVYAINESNHVDTNIIEYYCSGNRELTTAIKSILAEFKDAKEYGSVLRVSNHDWEKLYSRLFDIEDEVSLLRDITISTLRPIIEVANVLSEKYHVVCTNPPYMGNYTEKMNEYILPEYADSKYDLYSILVEVFLKKLSPIGKLSFVTGDSWMFTDSFINFRKKIINNRRIESLLHLGTKAFEAGFGTVAFTLSNESNENYRGSYFDLTETDGTDEVSLSLMRSVAQRYNLDQEEYLNISDARFAYKLPEPCFPLFRGDAVEKVAVAKAGVVSGDDKFFVKYWCEVNYPDIDFHAAKGEDYSKYHLFKNGGGNNRFYGNNYYVIRLKDLYDPNFYNKSIRRGDKDYYFKKCITWSKVGNQYRRFTTSNDSVCGTASPAIYLKDEKLYNYVLGFLNSKVARIIIDAFNPTMNLQATDVSSLPLLIDYDKKPEIDRLVQENVAIAKNDWDDEETSWDFASIPYISTDESIEEAYSVWCARRNEDYDTFCRNTERLNELFIEIYGLSGLVDSIVDKKDITIKKRTIEQDMKNLISYSVGCMFGRYSLDVPGICYAGGLWDKSLYNQYEPEQDGIIPVCEDEYFEDDILGLFERFIKCAFKETSIEENLTFIAKGIGGTGSAREILRKYFSEGFFKDHCAKYAFGSSGKRPIYWMFESGKKGGFRCLIYIHRYQPDTIARIRTDYVHEQQSRYRTAIEELEHRTESASTSERLKLNKRLSVLRDQAEEVHKYEEKIHHLADQMIKINIDDGVKKNYVILQDVLAKIK